MPSQSAIIKALDRVLRDVRGRPVTLDAPTERYVIFSDHHKGRRDGADDFLRCEAAYLTALDHYHDSGYTLIALGDAEEFWENRVEPVLDSYANVFASERRFLPDRYVKIWGNHDDEWESPRRVHKHLTSVFGAIEVQESVHFRVRDGEIDLGTLFLLHGHRGTLFSDLLAGLAKLGVRFIWRTIQRLTRIPSTTPATDACLREKHDRIMYRWATQQTGLVLIAGHTHRPVFSSKTHLQQLLEELAVLEGDVENDRDEDDEKDEERRGRVADLRAQIQHVREKTRKCEKDVPENKDRSRPCYFNTGCCCFADGDITGIELAEGELRLVKWGELGDGMGRKLLARTSLERVFGSLPPSLLTAED